MAKVDVHAAFDTMSQAAVVKVMSGVFNRRDYTVTKHAEVQPGERSMPGARKPATGARKQWCASASAEGQEVPLFERLKGELARQKKNTVFVEHATQKAFDAEYLVSLLSEHVECNVVKYGRNFFRQKRGVPQGSVLSSWLCNYFYADLEARHLAFLDRPGCLLMRLIDDFLLITLDKSKAIAFVRSMHRGFPDYGVEANQKKTLVNFDMQIDGDAVPRVPAGSGLSYCGMLINDQSLGISKSRMGHQEAGKTACPRPRDGGLPCPAVSSLLTVDFGRTPGQNFQRKTIGRLVRVSTATTR